MHNHRIQASCIQNSQRILLGLGLDSTQGQGSVLSQISAISRHTVTAQALETVLLAIIANFDIFRTHYQLDSLGVMYQEIQDLGEVHCDQLDWTNLNEDEIEQHKQQLLSDAGKRQPDFAGFKLTVASLPEQGSWIQLLVPTLNADMFSLGQLMRWLLQAAAHGSDSVLAIFNDEDWQEEVIQYGELAPWLDDFLLDDELAEARAQWHTPQTISPFSSQFGLARYITDPDETGYQTFTVELAQQFDHLSRLADTNNATLADAVCASLRQALSKDMGKINLTRVFESRADEELADALGPLSRVLPMVVESQHNLSEAVAAEVLAVEQAQEYAECFVRATEDEQRSFSFVFGAVKGADSPDGIAHGFIESINWTAEAAKVQFSLIEQGANSRLTVRFDQSYIEPAAMDSFIGYWLRSLIVPAVTIKRPAFMGHENSARATLNNVVEGLRDLPCDHKIGKGQFISPDGRTLTLAQLQKQSNQLANWLIKRGLNKGDIVALVMPRSIDFVLAMLAVVKAGAAYLPLDASLPKGRIDTVLTESAAKMVIDESAFADINLKGLKTTAPNITIDAEDLAYVLYTSGSTGTPKGVAISHRALANHMRWMIGEFDYQSDDVFLQRTSVGFDASVWELWAPILLGATMVIAEHQVNYDMPAMAQLLAQHRVTVLQMVPAQLSVLLQQSLIKARALRLLMCGGEALSTALARQAQTAFNCTVVNLYGPSECCIDALFWRFNPQLNTDFVPIGSPIDHVGYRVIKSNGEAAWPGEEGELWLTGAGLFSGYHGKPELTEASISHDEKGQRFYHTGDRVRILANGELMFLHRSDDQIKINGYRIELGEIESRIAAHPAVDSALVLAIEDKRLVAYVVASVVAGAVVNESAELEQQLKANLAETLPDYMQPSAYVFLAEWPLMNNGKIDKKALPAPDANQGVYVAPQSDNEKTLVAIWADILRIEAATLSVTANFFALGGDSILSIQAVSAGAKLGLHFNIKDLFDTQTIEKLAAVVTTSEATTAAVKTTFADENHYPATGMQQGLLFHSLLDSGSYVTQTLLHFGELNVDHFKAAWHQVVMRHDIFRTAFVGLEQGNAQQHVFAEVTLPWHELDLSQLNPSALAIKIDHLREQDKAQNFTVDEAPLMRMTLLKTPGNEYQLLWSHHHALLDGWCLRLVFAEVTECYRALMQGNEPQLGPVYAYREYVAWLAEQNPDTARTYWREQLADITEATPLPLAQKESQGATQNEDNESGIHQLPIVFSDNETEQLVGLARSTHTTVNVLLQAAWALLLSRYNDAQQVVFGAVTSGRPAQLPGSAEMLGLFINSLPVVVSIDASTNTNVMTYLQTIHQQLVERESHSYLPLQDIQKLSPLTLEGASTLFNSLLVFENYPTDEAIGEQISDAGLTVKNIRSFEQTGYGLTLVAHLDKTLSIKLQGQQQQFSLAALSQLGGHLKNLLLAFARSAQTPLSEIQMLSKTEVHHLTHELNHQAINAPQTQCIHQLFEAQADLHPDNIALVFEDHELTYQQLNQQANRLAHYLRSQGVVAETLVGLCVERGIEMVVAILAILKAGGAYVPLDPAYPAARLQHMLADSGVTQLLSLSGLTDELTLADTVNLTLLDQQQDSIAGFVDDNPRFADAQNPANLAYVIYTSGSTGLPKGVLQTHQNVARLFSTTADEFGFCAQDVGVLFHSIAFDFSVWELFSALFYGGKLVVPSFACTRDTEQFITLCQQQKVSILNQTPGAFNGFAQLVLQSSVPGAISLPALRYVIFGGEALQPDTLQPWWQQFGATKPQLVNMYGITETTVHVTLKKLQPNDHSSIGTVLADLNAYVLDSQLNLTPKGSVGELYIGGAGLARGYLNQPELTAERFIANPFYAAQAQNNSQRLYKTGDLVSYQDNGEMTYIGRIDNQVKIRGFRIELGEIEQQLSLCDGVTANVVMALGNRLIAYVVGTNTSTGTDGLSQQLKAVLPAHMVPSAFVTLPALPLTNNGKVDKKALPAPDISTLQGEYKAANTQTEQMLVDIWAQLLKIDNDTLSTTSNFFTLGGDSILSIQVVARAAEAGLHFSVKDLFTAPTISGLAQLAQAGVQVLAPQGDTTGELTLLPIQKAFFAQTIDNHHFNQSVMLTTPAGFTTDNLNAIVKQLYQRHDALRLRFDANGHATFLPLTDEMLSAAVVEKQSNTFDANPMQRSLNLEQGQLFKAVHIVDSANQSQSRLLLIIHHLVVDGVSWRILLQDIEALYQQQPLAAKTSSLQQWGEFLTQYSQSEALADERQYWLDGFNVPVTAIADLSANQSEQLLTSGFETIDLTLNKTLTGQLLSQSHQAYRSQINELLLAGLLLAVNRFGDSHAIRLDLEGHGRETLSENLDLSQTVGWFTSVYPLTLTLSDDGALPQLISNVKDAYRGIPNKGIGFGVLKQLSGDAELAALPASELVFNYLGQFDQVVNQNTGFGLADDSVGEEVSPARAPDYALSLSGLVSGGQLALTLCFDRAKYHTAAMQLFLQTMSEALKDIVAHCMATDIGMYCPSDFSLAKATPAQLNRWQSGVEIDDLYPATGMQQGLLFHSLLESGSYVTQKSMRFAALNVSRFKAAWQQVVQRHPIFRTAFVGFEQSNAHQLVHHEVQLPWHEQDLSELTETEQNSQIEAIRQADKLKNFTLSDAPLMRMTLLALGDGQYQLIWSHHHALLDGWCVPLVFAEVTECYRALQQGVPAQLDAVVSYRDYAAWLAAQNRRVASDFWAEQLTDITGATAGAKPLPLSFDATHDESHEKSHDEVDHLPGTHDLMVALDPSDTAKLVSVAQTLGITVNVVLQAAWALLLSRYETQSPAQKVIFGAVSSGRPAQLPGAEAMLGLFINTLPVVITVDGQLSLNQWLKTLHQQSIEREGYSYLPLTDIQQLSDVPHGLFDSLLVFENYPVDAAIGEQVNQAGLAVQAIESFEPTSFGLTLIAHLTDRLEVQFEGKQSQFNAAAVTQLATHLQAILTDFTRLTSADMLVGDVQMLSEDEVMQQIHDCNETYVDYPQDLCVHQLFEAQVIKTPDHTALIFGDESLTYQALNCRANRLAHDLRTQGVKADTLVGICVDRSIEMVVAILAILKAGGAYVPLDPALPMARMQYIVKDSGMTQLLTQSGLLKKLSTDGFELGNIQVTVLDLFEYDSDNHNLALCDNQSAANLGYVLYTSGSTGQPKGVAMPQLALTNLLLGMRRDCAALQQPVDMLQYSSLGFDMSFTEMFLSLLSGGKLLLMDKSWQTEPAVLVQAIIDARLNTLNLPYAILPLISQYCNSQNICFEQLKVIISTAEALKITPAIRAFFGRHPQLRLINHYGPSETHVVTRYTLPDDVNSWPDTPPVGHPIQNIQAYVLDEQLQPVPQGVSGLLYIGGAGLARGYLNKPDLTAQRFIDNPYYADEHHRDERYSSQCLYNTGDVVHRLADGQLVFSGRVDDQVKIRGFRVELSEVEHQLSLCDGVMSNVVVLSKHHLIAYVMADANSGSDTTGSDTTGGGFDKAKVNHQLAHCLPDYMLPSAIVVLPTLPLTVNGKVDHRALPEVDLSELLAHGDLHQGEYIAPQTEVERSICQIWAELLSLEVDDISTSAGFFALGGHSLLAVELNMRLNQTFDLTLELKDVFAGKTLAELADEINRRMLVKAMNAIEADDEEAQEEGWL